MENQQQIIPNVFFLKEHNNVTSMFTNVTQFY